MLEKLRFGITKAGWTYASDLGIIETIELYLPAILSAKGKEN